MGPNPETNPVLPGTYWKLWHHAIGGELMDVPEDSWATVLREKHPEMLHLLQFPHNGEPPKRLVTDKVVTPNSLHFVRNHRGMPLIDKDKFSLSLDGLAATPRSFTLDEIVEESRFPRIKKNDHHAVLSHTSYRANISLCRTRRRSSTSSMGRRCNRNCRVCRY